MPDDWEDRHADLFEEEEGEDSSPDSGLARTLATAFNYDFHQAVADLIDNSIAANAKNVWVYIESQDGPSDSDRPFVAVADDGHGISENELVKVMKYGHQSSNIDTNLGRFGLGMKTASTSQSWILSVATREFSNQEFTRRSWDIDYIEEIGEWRLRRPKSEVFPIKIMQKISDTSGTVILLNDLSRMKKNIMFLKFSLYSYL